MPTDNWCIAGVNMGDLLEPAKQTARELLAGEHQGNQARTVGGFSVARQDAIVMGDIVYEFTLDGVQFIIFEPYG